MTSMLIQGTEHGVRYYDDDSGNGRTLCGKRIGPWHVGPRFYIRIACKSCGKILDKAKVEQKPYTGPTNEIGTYT